MDIEQYIAEVKQRVDSLKELFPRSTTLEIKELASIPSGVFKSILSGKHERMAYTLDVNYENIELLRSGDVHKAYRYRILRGTTELIRFQTDRLGHPENAHFPPYFLSGHDHFTIDRYPPPMRDMNFLVVFRFYLDVVRMDGELPEPFKSARP